MFLCEFCKIFKNIFSFDKTPPDDCFLCLTFIEHLCEIAYFMYKLQNFNHQIQQKAILQVLFKHFIQEREGAIRRHSFN